MRAKRAGKICNIFCRDGLRQASYNDDIEMRANILHYNSFQKHKKQVYKKWQIVWKNNNSTKDRNNYLPYFSIVTAKRIDTLDASEFFSKIELKFDQKLSKRTPSDHQKIFQTIKWYFRPLRKDISDHFRPSKEKNTHWRLFFFGHPFKKPPLGAAPCLVKFWRSAVAVKVWEFLTCLDLRTWQKVLRKIRPIFEGASKF